MRIASLDGLFVVLGPPTAAESEEYRDFLGTCILQLQGKMSFGELSLHNKQVLTESLPGAFLHLDFWWSFFCPDLLRKLALFSMTPRP